MRVIERSEYRDEEGVISLENRLRGTLEHGLSWYGEMRAQEVITERLGRALGDDHTLIRNLPLPGTRAILPLVLVGPRGVQVLFPSTLRGVYRAKGDQWFRFAGGKFKRDRKDPMRRAQAMAERLRQFLHDHDLPVPEVQPVLVFTNPRTHVDTVRPAVRIVLRDALDHFAANLLKGDPVMDQQDVRAVVDLLLNPPAPAPPEAEEAAAPEYAAPATADPFELERRGPGPAPRRGPLGMTVQQWAILAGLAFVELVVLIAFAALIYANSLQP